jgi:hypothetical protein
MKTRRFFSHKFHAISTQVFTARSTSLFTTISPKVFITVPTTAVHDKGCPQPARPQKHSCKSSPPVFHPRPKSPLYLPTQAQVAASLLPQTQALLIPASSNPKRPQSPTPDQTPTYTRQLKPESRPISFQTQPRHIPTGLIHPGGDISKHNTFLFSHFIEERAL